MGKLRKTLALGAVGGLVGPAIAAAIAKRRLVPIDDETADEVALVTVFDGSRFASRSTAFRGGTALAWYGGLDVDLREARLDPAGARLRVRSLFAGTRVIVPEAWQVDVRATPFAGSVADETAGREGPGPVLEIQVLAAFGSVRVTSHVADEDTLIPPPGGERSSGGDGPGAGDGRADILARAEAEAAAVVEAAVSKAKGRARGGAKTTKAAAAADEVAPADGPLETESPQDEVAADEVGPSGSNGS